MVVRHDQIISRCFSQKVPAIRSRDAITGQLNRHSAFHTLTHTITLERDPGPFAPFSRTNWFLKHDTQASFSKAVKGLIKLLILLL